MTTYTTIEETPDPTPQEIARAMVRTAFRSDAFIVARGEKTKGMLEDERAMADNVAKQRAASGQPPIPPRVVPPPQPATPGALARLAGVLKVFTRADPAIDAETKVKFKDHFTGVLTNGQLILETLCDQYFDQAKPRDVTYAELMALGLNKGCEVLGSPSLVKWIKSITMGEFMPTGEIVDNFMCLVMLMKFDPDIVGGKLEYSLMDNCLTVNRRKVLDFADIGDIRINVGKTYAVPNLGRRGMHSFVPSDTTTQQAMEYMARKSPFHEAREYLESLRGTWDGVDRLSNLMEHIGAVTPVEGLLEEKEWAMTLNEQAKVYMRKTLLGCVARTFQPGCQQDTMLVLKSKQGTKKSSLFRALSPAGKFSDVVLDFGDKDAMMAMQVNSWYECAELAGMDKKGVQHIKAFMTTRNDSFRAPYGRHIRDQPRHCILVGSTNDDTPLRDLTGSRRFWIITIPDDTKINVPWVEANIGQIYAQTITLWDAYPGCIKCQTKADGEARCEEHRWWLSKSEDEIREQHNKEFTEVEPYDDFVQELLANQLKAKNVSKQGLHAAKHTDTWKVSELLEQTGMTTKEAHDPYQQKRMSGALKRTGFFRKHTKAGWVWTHPKLSKAELRLLKPEKKEPDETDEIKASSDE